MEDLTLEPLNSSSFFNESADPVAPVQAPPYGEEEGEEPLEVLELEAEENEKIESESVWEEETLFHPQDITWEYLKGLEKISLLTPEKEVELAKRIKRGNAW